MRPESARARRVCAVLALLATCTQSIAPALGMQPAEPSAATPVARPAADPAAATALRPFNARYALSWRGMSAASATLELREESPGRYVYQSRNAARGVFRVAFPGEARQSSVLEVDAAGVRPLRFRADDGTGKPDRTIELDFDWARGRVTGVAEQRPVDLPLTRGAQDVLSAQIALMRELAAGRPPSPFMLVDKDELKPHRYEAEPGQQLKTPLGTLDTVIYVSQREGSNRRTRVWYAPSLGYVPVRAEQRRGERVDFSMQIVALTR